MPSVKARRLVSHTWLLLLTKSQICFLTVDVSKRKSPHRTASLNMLLLERLPRESWRNLQRRLGLQAYTLSSRLNDQARSFWKAISSQTFLQDLLSDCQVRQIVVSFWIQEGPSIS